MSYKVSPMNCCFRPWQGVCTESWRGSCPSLWLFQRLVRPMDRLWAEEGIADPYTLLQEIKNATVMTTSSYDYINAVCWDLRVKVF